MPVIPSTASTADSQAQASQDARSYWLSVVRPRLDSLDHLHGQVHSSENVEKARRAISEELEAIQHASAMLKAHMNAFCPISRLPDEILARILGFHAQSNPHFYPDRSTIPKLSLMNYAKEPKLSSRLGWITSTHVCRRWREVALGNPWMWSDVTFSFGQEAVEEFLRRSKNLPLLLDVWIEPLGDKLDVDEWNSYISWTLEIVRDNIYRTHTLRMIDVFTSPLTGDWTFTALAAPLLRTCWLYSSRDTLHWPENIFAGSAPKLHDMWIKEFRLFPSHPAAFQTITHLCIDECDYHPANEDEDLAGVFRLGDILTALQRLPSLQSLTIIDSISPTAFSTRLNDMPQAILANLSFLHLQSTLDIVAILVHRIVWSAEATIKLACEADIEQHGITLALEALRDRFARDTYYMTRMRTMRVESEMQFPECSIRLWDEELCFSLPLHVPPESRFHLHILAAGSDEFFQELLEVFPPPNLIALSIETLPSRYAGSTTRSVNSARWLVDLEWRTLFKDCSHIRRVHCAGSGIAEGLIAALYDDIADRTSIPMGAFGAMMAQEYPGIDTSLIHTPWTQPERLLFPTLEELYFKAIDWSATLNCILDSSRIPPGRSTQPTAAVELLACIVAAREATDHPISAVTAY